MFFIFSAVNTTITEHDAYGHILGNKTQEWINPSEMVKIQFGYQPEKPLVYALTDLIFSVQDLKSGSHLKDFLASITVTQGDKIFSKFNNITVKDGDFSIKLRFVNEGTYQVITRIDSKKVLIMMLQ